MSEGEFEDVRPYIPNKKGNQIDETSDTYDTVDWLIKNIPTTTAASASGGFHPGFTRRWPASMVIRRSKAISRRRPVSDWFHGDDMHHNGALFLAQNYSFFTGFGQPRPVPTGNNDYVNAFPGYPGRLQFYLEMGGLRNSGDLYEQKLGTRIKFGTR